MKKPRYLKDLPTDQKLAWLEANLFGTAVDLLEIVENVMPDSYFSSDSKVSRAKKILRFLGWRWIPHDHPSRYEDPDDRSRMILPVKGGPQWRT